MNVPTTFEYYSEEKDQSVVFPLPTILPEEEGLLFEKTVAVIKEYSVPSTCHFPLFVQIRLCFSLSKVELRRQWILLRIFAWAILAHDGSSPFGYLTRSDVVREVMQIVSYRNSETASLPEVCLKKVKRSRN
jgi:hypothetical protein